MFLSFMCFFFVFELMLGFCRILCWYWYIFGW